MIASQWGSGAGRHNLQVVQCLVEAGQANVEAKEIPMAGRR